MERKTEHWLIGIFDTMLAVLFVPLLLGNVADVRTPDLDSTADDVMINRADCGLDVLALVSQLGAAVAVATGRGPGTLLQRAVFWSLLLRAGFTCGEAFLPNGGRLGGLSLLLGALILLLLTGVAAWSVVSLRKTEHRAA